MEYLPPFLKNAYVAAGRLTEARIIPIHPASENWPVNATLGVIICLDVVNVKKFVSCAEWRAATIRYYASCLPRSADLPIPIEKLQCCAVARKTDELIWAHLMHLYDWDEAKGLAAVIMLGIDSGAEIGREKMPDLFAYLKRLYKNGWASAEAHMEAGDFHPKLP